MNGSTNSNGRATETRAMVWAIVVVVFFGGLISLGLQFENRSVIQRLEKNQEEFRSDIVDLESSTEGNESILVPLEIRVQRIESSLCVILEEVAPNLSTRGLVGDDCN